MLIELCDVERLCGGPSKIWPPAPSASADRRFFCVNPCILFFFKENDCRQPTDGPDFAGPVMLLVGAFQGAKTRYVCFQQKYRPTPSLF